MNNEITVERGILNVTGETIICVNFGNDSYIITPEAADKLIKDLTASLWALHISPEKKNGN